MFMRLNARCAHRLRPPREPGAPSSLHHPVLARRVFDGVQFTLPLPPSIGPEPHSDDRVARIDGLSRPDLRLAVQTKRPVR